VNPSQAPTVQPSPNPTTSPTLNNKIAFSVAQELEGITSAQFSSDVNAELAFKTTAAECMSNSMVNISVSDITIVSVVNVGVVKAIADSATSQSFIYRDSNKHKFKRTLTPSAIKVTYNIEILGVASGVDKNAEYNATINALTSKIASGTFTSTLQVTSQALAASSLTSATASQLPTYTKQTSSIPVTNPPQPQHLLVAQAAAQNRKLPYPVQSSVSPWEAASEP
jgi:hypothetical protein